MPSLPMTQEYLFQLTDATRASIRARLSMALCQLVLGDVKRVGIVWVGDRGKWSAVAPNVKIQPRTDMKLAVWWKYG